MLLIASGYAQRERRGAAGLGDLGCYIAIGLGTHVRRLAHRQDHGPEDHQAQAGGRLLRRDRRRDDAVPRHRRWASRCRPRTPSPARSSASARCGAPRAVRWGVAGNIVWAWIFTIPASAFVAAVFYGAQLLAAARAERARAAAQLEVALGGEGDRRHQHGRAEQQRRRRRRVTGRPAGAARRGAPG